MTPSNRRAHRLPLQTNIKLRTSPIMTNRLNRPPFRVNSRLANPLKLVSQHRKIRPNRLQPNRHLRLNNNIRFRHTKTRQSRHTIRHGILIQRLPRMPRRNNLVIVTTRLQMIRRQTTTRRLYKGQANHVRPQNIRNLRRHISINVNNRLITNSTSHAIRRSRVSTTLPYSLSRNHNIIIFNSRNIRRKPIPRLRPIYTRKYNRRTNITIRPLHSNVRSTKAIMLNMRHNSRHRRSLQNASIKNHPIATSILFTNLRYRTRHPPTINISARPSRPPKRLTFRTLPGNRRHHIQSTRSRQCPRPLNESSRSIHTRLAQYPR